MKKIIRTFKNIPTTAKMLAICLPAVIALIVISIISSNQVHSTNKETTDIIYNQLYTPAVKLLNADRSLYKAYVAENELRVLWEQKKASLSAGGVDAIAGATLIQSSEKEQEEYVQEHTAVFNQSIEEVKQSIEDAYINIKNDNEEYKQFKHTETGDTLESLYDEFNRNYEMWLNSYNPETGVGNYDEHTKIFEDLRYSISKMLKILDDYTTESRRDIEEKITTDARITFITILIVILIIALLAGIVLFSIIKIIKYLTSVTKRIADGELTLEMDESTFTKDDFGKLSRSIGQILHRLAEYYNYIQEITSVLEKMSQGDMRINLEQSYDGEFKQIKVGLLAISNSLNTSLSNINEVAEQVSFGSKQVASAAQDLANGSSEQAASIEELTNTVEHIANMANENRDNIILAKDFMDLANSNVEDSNEHMKNLTNAMHEISAAYEKISTITKSIDDIAFQTNILALNAAIEAARAGAAGKGFSIVADEVRNLASKSAEAAKHTEEIISESIKSVKDGGFYTEKVEQALIDVKENSIKIASIFAEIEKSSIEQANSIEQINIGLDQISSIVQTNAASAEQNSAASDEMSLQALTLKQEVNKFKLDNLNLGLN